MANTRDMTIGGIGINTDGPLPTRFRSMSICKWFAEKSRTV